MRSKAPLVLMEQTVMVLVFALAAAISLRAFVWANQQSEFYANRDRAMVVCQNTAETLKGCHGDFIQAAQHLNGQNDNNAYLTRYFDAEWNPVDIPERGVFQVTAQRQASGHPLLGTGDIIVYDGQHNVLCALTVSWQEVGK